MKTIISLVAVGFSLVLLTGCYTRIVTTDNETDQNQTTIIVIVPPPPPPDPCPEPLPPVYEPTPPPVQNPPQKIRQPDVPTRPNNDGGVRDKLRGSGSRNNSDGRNR